MAKVKQWHEEAAREINRVRGFILTSKRGHADVMPTEEMAQIIADAEPATELADETYMCLLLRQQIDQLMPMAQRCAIAENELAKLRPPSATGPTPDTLEPEEFIKAAFPDADLDKLEINARIVIKWLHEALAYAASKSGATPPKEQYETSVSPVIKQANSPSQMVLEANEVSYATQLLGEQAGVRSVRDRTGEGTREKEVGVGRLAGATPEGEARRSLEDKLSRHEQKDSRWIQCEVAELRKILRAESAPIPPTQPEKCPTCGSNDPAYDTFTHVMSGIVTCPNAWHKVAAAEHPDNDVRCNLGKPNCTIHHEEQK